MRHVLDVTETSVGTRSAEISSRVTPGPSAAIRDRSSAVVASGFAREEREDHARLSGASRPAAPQSPSARIALAPPPAGKRARSEPTSAYICMLRAALHNPRRTCENQRPHQIRAVHRQPQRNRRPHRDAAKDAGAAPAAR